MSTVDPPRKALIADDDALIRAMLSSELKSMGLSVVEAQNGEQAVELWARESPDVLFLDLLMPKLNGLDALKRIRDSPPDRGRQVPAILVTALTKDTVRQFESAGVKPEAYLEKPFRLKAVAQVLKNIFGDKL
jgi:two-component system chemotaxis response regulator CheY